MNDQIISAREICALPDEQLEAERARIVQGMERAEYPDSCQFGKIIVSIIEREQRARAKLYEFLAPGEVEYPVSDGIFS